MSSDNDVFDEPSISRQWVLRRLQQALTTDLAAGAFYSGLRRFCRRRDARALGALARGANFRATEVRALILDEGGTPYQTIGLARACARLGGTLIGPVGFVWRFGVRQLTEHTLQEYDTLAAHLRTAPGISPGLADRAAPLVDSATAGFESSRKR